MVLSSSSPTLSLFGFMHYFILYLIHAQQKAFSINIQ